MTGLVDTLVQDTLPWLLARDRDGASRPLCDGLGEVAEALTIIALRPSLARGAAAELRRVRRQMELLEPLAARLSEAESQLGGESKEEGRAALADAHGLYFVARPDRPATEAHVLRHHPRPPRVWSPARRLGSTGSG